MRQALCLVVFYFLLSVCLLPGQITGPVTIPLYHPEAGDTNKWGLYLSVGGGSSPQLFELDTGGTGFYAAYATNGASPWWGSSFTYLNSNGTNVYDSGLTYSGNVVSTAVSFWSGSNEPSPLLTSAGNLLVGQSTSITKNGTTYWTESQPSGAPAPINGGSFYGDFGLALNSASNSLVNIVAQMTYSGGVVPGFLINTPLNGSGGYLQIGLLPSQTNDPSFNWFAMNPDTTSSGAFSNNPSIGYKSEQLFNATMTLSTNNATIYSANIGVTPDTGATPRLHNTTNDPNFPSGLSNSGSLASGLSFILSATNTAGVLTNITSFITSQTDAYDSNLAVVNIQNTGSIYTNYYYNGGLYLFNQDQVAYNLQDGSIGFGPLPVPEPSGRTLFLAGAVAVIGIVIRKRRRTRAPRRFAAGIKAALVASAALATGSGSLRAQVNPDGSVSVPIYVTNSSNYSPSHYTIYAGIGGGPLLPYLFDTGAPYLMSFYNTDTSQTATNGSFTFSYGLTYFYQTMSESISLGASNSSTPLITSSPIAYGQVRYTSPDTYITNPVINPATSGTSPTADGTYGDFGAGFYGSTALATVLTQMPLGDGLLPGYTLNLTTNLITGSGQGSLTLGVSGSLLSSYATNPSVIKLALSSSGSLIPTANGTVNGTGRAQVEDVSLSMQNSSGAFTNTQIPYVIDTGGGANVAIYSTNLAAFDGATNVVVSTTNPVNPQVLQTILNDTTPWNGEVAVVSNPSYGGYTNGGERMNSGGYFFENNIVTFDLQNGYAYVVPVDAVPEPSTYALFLFSGAASLWALRRRKS